MKKTITSFLTAALAVSMGVTSVNAQSVYPYFATAEVASDITTVATTVAAPSTALVDLVGDFTAQLSGTVGVEIKLTNGNIFYAYTPTATGDVRIVKRNGIVYVYEGTAYKGTIATQYESVVFPEITDATAVSSTDQMLQNASFETPGTQVGTGTNYNFGTPWETNVVVLASLGSRFTSATGGNVNGTWECIWRGTANDLYFAQPVIGVEANKSYKVIVRQIASGNGNADFNVGFGSTASGLELAKASIRLGTTYDGTRTTTIVTPPSVSENIFFTFKNTPINTSSAGSDPLTQMDYIALVEGVSSVTPGISGNTGDVYFVNDVFAPQIALNSTNGDYYDMTSSIFNPSFEQTTLTGWTNTGSMGSQGNADFAKAGSFYCEKWVNAAGNLTAVSIEQSLTGLPNGTYKLQAVAQAVKQGATPAVTETGAYLYAGTAQTTVSTSGEYEVANVVVTDGTLKVGFKTAGTIAVNWVAVDNFRLYYYGPALSTKVDDASAAAAGVSVYPTLTKGNVNVDSDSKDCTVTVLDLTGKVVSVQSGAGVQAVQLNKAGIYLIKTESEGAVKVTKVCKTN